ncbi:MAG TPA: LysR family transcriptional regulator [Oligoflexus sp.]|uniref:LysR family transcriptional regulator n=1 Tax=Oligoflexus sp. TaxID=1971216 RepID=UPI002D3D0C30|nr:LysR family transcriptional regulator [Oligoflexus sp.]HYX34546.1 LysR family transcriptional regulator [Oligoflexus sp.]
MFNYNHLFYFFTVARLGGMIKAAHHLRIAQPSLTVQIKALEAHTNRTLFKKAGRGVALTQDGEVLYSICRRMFEPVDDLSEFLENKDSRVQKTIRIGVSDELERPFVVNLIRKIFRKDLMNQDVHVSMRSDKHRVLLDKLRWKELDVLLSNHTTLGDDFAVLAEISMPVVAVANRSILKNNRKSQAKDPLGKLLQALNLGLVVPVSEHKLRIETEIQLQKLRINRPVIFESDILSAVVRAAVEGVGVGFLPKPYVQKELTSGTLVKLNDGQKLWNHVVYQIAPKNRQLDLVNSEIRDYFRVFKDKD